MATLRHLRPHLPASPASAACGTSTQNSRREPLGALYGNRSFVHSFTGPSGYWGPVWDLALILAALG